MIDDATAVYTHKSGDGEILYIGISNNPAFRTTQHSIDKHWFKKVKKIEIDWFDTRVEALEIEKSFIKSKRPKYNVIHNRPVVYDLSHLWKARKKLLFMIETHDAPVKVCALEMSKKTGINVNSFLCKEVDENPDAANYDCDAKDCLSLIEEELTALGQTPSGRFERICGAKFVQGELLDGCDDYACPHLKWITGGAAQ